MDESFEAQVLNLRQQAELLGAEKERSRIIKLLEEQCERPLDPKWEHYKESCSCWQIALIKGEK